MYCELSAPALSWHFAPPNFEISSIIITKLQIVTT
jgi:hypothetical protein